MTVCIAAICWQEENPFIVTCTDWQQESVLGKSETADKMRVLPKDWLALMADTLCRAEDLVAHYETKLRVTKGFEDDKALFAAMKEPAFEHKQALTDEYVRQLLGMTYKEFLDRASTLPQDFVAEKLKEISAIKLGASLILAGFCEVQNQSFKEKENLPYLFVVEDNDQHQDVVRTEYDFAVIGSGAYVATPALHQRKQASDKGLMETIYNVYEAKRLAEVVPGVGELMSITVTEPKGAWRLSDAGYERCGEIFRQIGPKLELSENKKKKLFEATEKYLEPFDDEEEESAAGKATGA